MGAQASAARAAGYFPQNRSITLYNRQDIILSLDSNERQCETLTTEPTHTGMFVINERSGQRDSIQTPDVVSAEYPDGDMMLVVDEDEILRQNMAARKPQFVFQDFKHIQLDHFEPPKADDCDNSITPSIMDGYAEPAAKSHDTVDFSHFQQIQADKNVGKPEIIGVTGFRFRRRATPQEPPDEEAQKRIERFRQSVRQRYVI